MARKLSVKIVPGETHHMSFRLSAEMIIAIDAVSADIVRHYPGLNTSRTETIRLLLYQALEARKKK